MTATPIATYAAPADEADLQAAADALGARGYQVRRVSDAAAARAAALEVLPEGAEVFTVSSVSAEAIGLTEEIDHSGRYVATRPRLLTMDMATQMGEMRRLGAAPEWVVGSVHALTRDGDLVIASASGSQLASMAYGAQHVLFIVGAQKVVCRPGRRDAPGPRVQPAAGGRPRP